MLREDDDSSPQHADMPNKGVVDGCSQREALAAEYAASVRTYMAAVEEMERMRDSADVETYQNLFNRAEAKRRKCERARVAIRTHIREHHRCVESSRPRD